MQKMDSLKRNADLNRDTVFRIGVHYKIDDYDLVYVILKKKKQKQGVKR